jgi:hypothetical protein
MKTIDTTPTWESLMPALVEVAANGTTAEARELAAGELLKLARIVDAHIANLKTLADDGLPIDETEGADRLCPDTTETVQHPEWDVNSWDPCPECGIRNAHAFGCLADNKTTQ